MWHRTVNDDPGSLITGPVRLSEGDPVVIAGESKPRRVTYVMGSDRGGWRACFKGQGRVPTGPVRWRVAEGEATRWRRASAGKEALWQADLPRGLCSDEPVIVTGFDSAWTPGRRGGIASVLLDRTGIRTLQEPVPASFEDALEVIRRSESIAPGARHLIMIDQSLIVPNATGSRPVERALSRVAGRYGGGVQPSNRSRLEMFGPTAPLWSFLERLDASLDPRAVRHGPRRVALEVFPAFAVLGLFPELRERGEVARYNPERRATFRPEDWSTLCRSLGSALETLGAMELAAWCTGRGEQTPRKADQDALDSVICTLAGLLVWGAPWSVSVLGDLGFGYVLVPCDDALDRELREAALAAGVPSRRLEDRVPVRGSPAALLQVLSSPGASSAAVDELLSAIVSGRRPARYGTDVG